MKNIYWQIAIAVIFTLASAQVTAVGCGALGGGPSPYMNLQNSYWYATFTAAQKPVVVTGIMGNGVTPTGSNCAPFPAANDFCCDAFMGDYASIAWRLVSPSQMVASNKCTFMTAMGGTCDMQASDGLPVELIEFLVEPHADAKTETLNDDPVRTHGNSE